MKVYIVEECYPYEGCTVLKVFSSREAAEKFIKKKVAQLFDEDLILVAEWEVED